VCSDLVDAFEQRLGRDAVRELLGGPPAAFPDRYALASPIAPRPIGVPVIGVHGTADDRVPVRQTERFAARVRRPLDPPRRRRPLIRRYRPRPRRRGGLP
jgi:dipeptidyl aminopeptidase/acylaminoacyl peptidase